MKRPNRYGGFHAQAPQPTRITAIAIISFFIAAVLVGSILLICASHKLSGGVNETPASPLGGESSDLARPKLARDEVTTVTTHTLVDEPLVGGTGVDKESAVQSSTPAPQQRDRPAIEAMQNAVVEAQKARERADLVARINNFLAGSPLAGLGEYMVAEQERTTVSARLCCAVAAAESSICRECMYPYQAWGMYGVHPGSWEDGITRWFDNMLAHPSWSPWQTGWDIQRFPEYCESRGTTTYAENVTGLAESI